MVSGTSGTAGQDLLPAIDRRDQPSNKGDVVVQVVSDWFTYHDLKKKGVAVRHVSQVPSTSPTAPQNQAPSQPQTINPTSTPGGTDMDLGTLATDLLRQAGTAYIQRELGPQPVGYAQPSLTPAFIPDIDLPFVDIVPDGSCKRRKRRRALVTASEISQLASLKAIASPSEVKLFLAKRLRN